MSHIPLINGTQAPAASQPLLDQIQRVMGGTPNMFRAVAHSPAALQSMWGSFAALSGGTLDAAMREQIAVAVADRNACEYCLAAHVALGAKAGVLPEALDAAQAGQSVDSRTAAVLHFALQLVEHRGQVAAADIQALRDQGLGDGQIVEVIANVALNLFTNYVNVALMVPMDIPAVGTRLRDSHKSGR